MPTTQKPKQTKATQKAGGKSPIVRAKAQAKTSAKVGGVPPPGQRNNIIRRDAYITEWELSERLEEYITFAANRVNEDALIAEFVAKDELLTAMITDVHNRIDKIETKIENMFTVNKDSIENIQKSVSILKKIISGADKLNKLRKNPLGSSPKTGGSAHKDTRKSQTIKGGSGDEKCYEVITAKCGNDKCYKVKSCNRDDTQERNRLLNIISEHLDKTVTNRKMNDEIYSGIEEYTIDKLREYIKQNITPKKRK